MFNWAYTDNEKPQTTTNHNPLIGSIIHIGFIVHYYLIYIFLLTYRLNTRYTLLSVRLSGSTRCL